MNELFQTMKEVRECGQRNANYYLDHGYILLDIQSSARGAKFNDEAEFIDRGDQVLLQYYGKTTKQLPEKGTE